jgi:hypothetical protein
MKPITGQYECVHSSGVGLDYFTSRIDRLTLQSNGRFSLIIQSQSRAANAAQTLLKGQQISAAAPEVRREGNYTQQDADLSLHFDDGGFEPAHLALNREGLQIGPNFFNKVSDSTMLPPTRRLKKDMDDIAKGLKIASTLGGMAVKAAKTIQGTIQVAQGTEPQQNANSTSPTANSQAGPSQPHVPGPPPTYAQPPMPARSATPAQPEHVAPENSPDAIFCDQCGARSRPGKRFCNNCGARLA